MDAERLLIIDAIAPDDASAQRVRGRVLAALRERGACVEIFAPDQRRFAHCIGCFHCWTASPGVCRYADGLGDLLRAITGSDTVLWLERLRFGGHSAALKQVLDRMLGLLLPDFVLDQGELSHPPRYPRPPRLVAIAVTERPTLADVSLYRAIIGRNARNLHAPCHSATVIGTSDDPETQRTTIIGALTRSDPVPSLAEIARLVPRPTVSLRPASFAPGNALLIVGSPRRLTPSTSLRLGERLLGGLQERGWTGETMTASRSLTREPRRRDLLEAWARADLVVVAAPIYLDTPPYLLTAALEVVEGETRSSMPRAGRRIAAICNSSFPQAAQSSLALAVYARFAAATGLGWAGGLALGGGAWIEGRPLAGPGRSPLPTGHVLEALDLTAAALAAGGSVSPDAIRLMSRTPFRGLPFWLWQRIYGSVTGHVLRTRAADNGIGPEGWAARPLAESRIEVGDRGLAPGGTSATSARQRR